MDIKDILDSFGLDFSNPEVKRGAMEAIDAILNSRAPAPTGGGGGQGGETEVEIDPDLLQPSIKHAPDSDQDVEIEDEENILGQVKHKDSDEPIENTNSSGKDSSSEEESSSTENSDSTDDSSEIDKDGEQEDNNDEAEFNDATAEEETEEDEVSNSDNSDEEAASETNETDLDSEETDTEESDSDNSDNEEESDEAEGSQAGADTFEDEPEEDKFEDEDSEEDFDEEEPDDEDELDDEDSEDEPEEDESDEEAEFEFDEDDLIDDELKNSTEDEEVKSKHEARKIKRERTLAAAKKTLADAQAKRVAPALIRELEKAIEALEALTEAVAKSLKDISDTEFNQLVNRVFDAIQACGESGLTFTSEEEREAQVKEIKDDISKAETQTELSAEDIAKIRAEVQAVKAREKETDKYKAKSASSFKGFQEFLNSLYRAIALQVSTEETRDDSWAALSRRNSGAGVLRQGQKINELPNKKIPIIDFYFDQSGSWSEKEIAVGQKAVQRLADMEAEGKIKVNIYYFSDDVFTDAASARAKGGTGGWNEIVKNVIATQATNVIIMTDSDMESWWTPQNKPPLKYTVPGYVWYLWKKGSNAPRLPRDLKGRGGVQQFSFNSSDM